MNIYFTCTTCKRGNR